MTQEAVQSLLNTVGHCRPLQILKQSCKHILSTYPANIELSEQVAELLIVNHQAADFPAQMTNIGLHTSKEQACCIKSCKYLCESYL